MATSRENILKSKREYQQKRRKERFSVKVEYTPEEGKQIIQNAANAGITVTEFVKETSLKRHIKPLDPNKKISLEIKAEVRRVGINVNQIARSVNAYYSQKELSVIEKQLENTVAELRNIIAKLS